MLVLLTTFAAGAATQRGLIGQARAAAVSSTPTIYVPAEGLVFRSPDGTPIARISRDARGGVIEIYDDHQRVARSVPEAAAVEATHDDVARDPGF